MDKHWIHSRAFSQQQVCGVVHVRSTWTLRPASCVLVQRTIHKNLHFKNSITRLFRQLWPYSFRLPRPQQVSMDKHWIHSHAFFQQQVCGVVQVRSAWTLRPGTAHHPQKPALQEFSHSLVSAAVAMGA
jgi:predicted XRE-type DNA-binding protein